MRLADVVQQRGEKQHAMARQLGREPRGQRVLRAQLAAAQRAQVIDGRHRVHVHRVHVVGVAMHAPDQRRKLGDHRHQQPDVVQVERAPSRARSRVCCTTHRSLQKQLARARACAQRRTQNSALAAHVHRTPGACARRRAGRAAPPRRRAAAPAPGSSPSAPDAPSATQLVAERPDRRRATACACGAAAPGGRE